MFWWLLVFAMVGLAVYDLLQRRHAILRNFPIIGHFRYWLEAVGPELRQYIVTDNNEERPFSRDQRRWVYASSKGQNNYFGFGTDNAFENTPDYVLLKHSVFPHQPAEHDVMLECAKTIGEARGRAKAFRPRTVAYVSAMSYGSLSGAAVEALNRGCARVGALHNTGEGGISGYHDQGGELIWQLGTGYFGARDREGKFSLSRLADQVGRHRVRAIEIKLSQGAKPGKGGVLPAAKITPEIASIRGIPMGQDCLSPAHHAEFGDVDSLLDFVERIAEATGLPVGIKSAVGVLDFWHELADQMAETGRGVDYIQIDGGEGGTGAAPLAFSDHVSLPFRIGFPRVYRCFAERGLQEQIVFVGSGRLGFPADALLAIAMGCDMVALAREPMLAIGCIQAQRCHSGHCPTGVATQNRWLVRGLDSTSKADRVANYLITLDHELRALTNAAGAPHPALITLDRFEILRGALNCIPAREHFGYEPSWGLPSEADQARLRPAAEVSAADH